MFEPFGEGASSGPPIVPRDHPLSNAIQAILGRAELIALRVTALEENQRRMWQIIAVLLTAILGVQLFGVHP